MLQLALARLVERAGGEHVDPEHRQRSEQRQPRQLERERRRQHPDEGKAKGGKHCRCGRADHARASPPSV